MSRTQIASIAGEAPPRGSRQASRLESLHSLSLPADQPSRQRPARRRLIGGVVAVAVAVLLVAGIWMRRDAGHRAATVSVLKITASGPRAQRTVILTGTGYVVSRRKYVDVGATVPGRIVWLGAEEGDHVRTGGELARLDDRLLAATHQGAVAALATAEARLAELRAGSRAQEIDTAQAFLAEADANLRLATATFQRAARLLAEGIIALHELDVAQNARDLAASRRQAAAQQYELVRLGPRAESIAIAVADVARASAAVRQAAAQLDETVIRAPFDGVVIEKLRDTGDFVVPGGLDRRGSGSGLFRIASTAEPRVEVEVSESSIAQLADGQPASVVLDAAPGHTYRARLTKIHPSANRQKATVKVELDVLDADVSMKPEMTAKVEFVAVASAETAATVSTRILIPSSAIVHTASGSAVFVVSDGVARAQPVRLRAAGESEVDILEGLHDGDLVVIRGPRTLSDGQTVQVVQ